MGVEVLHAASSQVGTGNFVASAATVVPVTIQGAAAQSANLTEWKNSAGTVIAKVANDGAIYTAFLSATSPVGTFVGALTVIPDTTTRIGAVVRGKAGQSASLQEWQNSAGTALAALSASGVLGIGFVTNVGNTGSYIDTSLVANTVTVNQRVTNAVALQVRGAAGQTSDIVQATNSAGTVLAKVTSGGNFSNVGKIFAGTDAGALQTAAGLYAGTGAPNNANGNDGDYYLRSDGGLGTHVYFKAAGAWAGII